jgi:hypothetical protein
MDGVSRCIEADRGSAVFEPAPMNAEFIRSALVRLVL